METQNDLTAGATLYPRHAILIYDDEHRETDNSQPSIKNTIATMHDVFMVKDRPVIGEGRCVDPEAIAELSRSLSKTKSVGEYLPENVLTISLTRMVWWHPSCIRRLWFKCDNKDLNALNKRKARHPALVFDITAGRELAVYALAESKRPTPATQLYRAPYYNVSERGGVQLCGCDWPDDDDMSMKNIPAWEHAFYDSSFTHSAGTTAVCKFPGGQTALWKAMCATLTPDAFPSDCLIKTATLAKILNEQES